MTCCLTAVSHYLNQCSLIITRVLWHWHETNSTRNVQETDHWIAFATQSFKTAVTSTWVHFSLTSITTCISDFIHYNVWNWIIYPFPSIKFIKIWKWIKLEPLRSEIPPATPWLPILVIHIRSQVKTTQSQSYKFKKIAKISNFEILQETFAHDTPSEVVL